MKKSLCFAALPIALVVLFGCDKANRLINGDSSSPVQSQTGAVIPPTPNECPPSITLGLYRDSGSVDADVNIQSAGGLRVEATGDAAEGAHYLTFPNSDPLQTAVAVTFDRNTPNLKKNLRQYEGGSLKFFIRLHRPLAANEETRIEIYNETFNVNPVSLIPEFHFNRNSTDWQEVNIPLGNFYIDLGTIWSPFHLSFPTLNSQLAFDLDNIRWEK